MKKYFFREGTVQHGPFSLEELRSKKITAETSVWFDPMPKWELAGQVEELKAILYDPTAPLPVATEADLIRKEFYYKDDKGQQGPFKLELLKGKNLSSETPVWYDPLAKWTTVGEIPALDSILKAATQAFSSILAGMTDEDWHNRDYFYKDNAGQKGPFKLDQLKVRYITPETPIWFEPLPRWTTAGDLPGLKEILGISEPELQGAEPDSPVPHSAVTGTTAATAVAESPPKKLAPFKSQNTTHMKVRFAIQKGKEKLKTGVMSSKEVDKYELTATFIPSEREKKIYNDHPLFKETIFMEYNEVDKFATGFLNLGKEQAIDLKKQITVGSIYNSPTYTFRAYSVDRIVELRSLVIEAGERFANNVKVLEGLEGMDEIEFKPTE